MLYIQGDCLNSMDLIPPGSIDLILSDLPYGQTKSKWDKRIDLGKLWKEYERIIKPNGAIILFASGMFTAELMKSNPKMWRYNLVWEKTSPTGFLNAKRMPLRAHEDICIFYKKMPVYNPQMSRGVRKVATAAHKRNSKSGDSYGKYRKVGYDSDKRYPRSVMKFKTDKQTAAYHSAQKPVALLEYLIRMYSNEGDIVLDSCMGSGSTGVACARTRRKFIGIEIDDTAFNQAFERVTENAIEINKRGYLDADSELHNKG